jgi:carboxymethylenebutenolidase
MTTLTPRQEELIALWEEHLKHEFETRDTAATLETMLPDACVNHVPVLTGGSGHTELAGFYSTHFIPQMPPDMSMTPVSRTVGDDRLIDEFVVRFTHSLKMDWMLPGVEPTGKAVEVAFVVVVEFEGNKLTSERIYWDQATVLVQLGLIETRRLPVTGVESARKVLDPSLTANELIRRAGGRS